MSATPISQSTRYYRQGISKVLWVPSIATLSAPSRAELNAGIDLSPEISASSGWEVTGNTEDTNALGSRFTGKVPSNTTAGDSSLTFFADATSVDVRTVLLRGDFGNVVWMDEGDVVNYLMDVFPVQVTGVPKQRDISAVAGIMVNFATLREPAENVSIPA
ncbi:hypothetical protein NMG29_06655 [Streptomyces cocklensis]|uniref:Uncharacterized protein n=1 Tax=Actinacidiphila cocklensis TaxID=887465 RepID=A0A9W4DJX4_9ACTN|nr:hypothetical protein [Actinacidiphila cocklensis]MDD1057912.1 hypothetical protein [Actinacidiphila cocklensis]CAG6392776.1 conserved hypothetical protein [Actinacidiphila cocklensis]